ncbi:hypothetical protein niasHT_032089 [Heterodera trifolii]|uniref:G-protein coupled receptors family 1 profile domain-containing protein n=1 Tax=Heterodera trifolii TaxID=157864 RepID=A0ABD2I9S6_9BILA
MKAELIASFQLLVAFPLLLLHLFTLPLFLSVREFRSRICFRLMFALGIADSLQLMVSVLFSLFVFLDFNSGIAFEKVCGAFMQLCWDLVIFLHFLLAANRLLIFVKASFKPSILNKEPKSEQILFNSLLALIWLVLIALIIAFQTPFLGVLFHRDYVYFLADQSLPAMPIFRLCEFYWTCFLLPITTTFYISIVVLLKKYRKKSSDGKTAKKFVLNKQEWRILGQSVAMFVLMAFIVAMWDLVDLFSWVLPDGLILFSDFFFLLFCGINPILYLCTLPEFRQHFFRLYCACFANVSVPPLVVAVAPANRRAFPTTVNVPNSSSSAVTVVGQWRNVRKITSSQSMANGGRTCAGVGPTSSRI